MQAICCSGGAKGADTIWGETAAEYGHDVIHFTFDKSRHKIPEGQEYVLSREQLLMADKWLVKAQKTLKRKWPVTNPHVASLLRRNYYQVAHSDSLYAISEIDSCGQVSGGTAWAVQMMIDMKPDLPIWVFDQKISQWYVWKGAWVSCLRPPVPSGTYAGIGSREINESGIEAIRSVYF